MEILGMRRAKDHSWKTKAFFKIKTKNFLIHECRLVMGETRLVVQMPFRTYIQRGKKIYEPVIEILTIDYLEAVGAQALEIYNKLP